MIIEEDVDMILTVVRKGWAESVFHAAIEAGARGGHHIPRPRDQYR